MKYWLLACSAFALVAAHAAYTFSNRQGRRRGRLTNDQVSSEWLATAKIHEDHNR
jgi:peptidoglycan/LPS O-acetylase OafA/YrhL